MRERISQVFYLAEESVQLRLRFKSAEFKKLGFQDRRLVAELQAIAQADGLVALAAIVINALRRRQALRGQSRRPRILRMPIAQHAQHLHLQQRDEPEQPQPHRGLLQVPPRYNAARVSERGDEDI